MIEKKITPRNYAAQAQRDLRHWAENAPRNDPRFADDAAMGEHIADIIGRSVHFAMPDGGMLFADDLRGMWGNEFRLPYPSITAEYYIDGGEIDRSVELPVPKRLAVAVEVDTSDVEGTFGRPRISARFREALLKQFACEERGRAVLVMSACEWPDMLDGGEPHWAPLHTGWLMPTRGWDTPRGKPLERLTNRDGRGESKGGVWTGLAVPLMPAMFTAVERNFSSAGELLRNIAHDLNDEIRVVLELCEALTCSNVKATTLQEANPALNRRRVRDGKIPILETKVLTIDVPVAKSTGKSTGAMGDRGSPREHLRRGHIREYRDGKRVWVSSAVIGGGNPGRIDKTYRIRGGRAA